MDNDPDIPLPSVETKENTSSRWHSTATPKSERSPSVNNTSSRWNVSVSVPGRVANSVRLDSSPSRSPSKLSRTRPSTPSNPSLSRSSSVASLRNDRSTTPRLDKKRSTPNLSVRSSTPAGHQPQFRRASSNLNPSTPLRGRMDKPQLTPASVAQEFLRRELATHEKTSTELLVVTHDACYGHRFSRPRTRKSDLESIVERPERIQATVLGVSTAYVRLGDCHMDGKNAPHPHREPGQIPFRLLKSTRNVPLSHPTVIAVHGTKWMEALQLMCDTAEAKLAMGQKELARPIGHTKDSKGNSLPALHSGDLYLASESLTALQGCLGGVCDAIDAVYDPASQTKRAFVCIRPPGHHCSAEMPSGFCWLNNVHVGISYAAANHGLTHAAIIDFDLHHGDGSQTITWQHNQDINSAQHAKSASSYRKTPIGYYSLHDINSYPCEYGDEEKVRNASTCIQAHGQSVWNVHLEPWKTHADFFQLYETRYAIILEKARSFLSQHAALLRQSGVEPKAAIFLSSGFDASEWESPGMQRHQVNVPTDFYARLTADVVKLASEPGIGVDGRVISVLEGGYSDRALTSGVLSHLCGLATSVETEADDLLALSALTLDSGHISSDRQTYDSSWWQPSQLEALEAMVAGRLPPPEKPKDKLPNSYSSPTHASTAKMTEIAKDRRSVASQLEARLAFENAPPEPVPEVDWVVAAYELSRLLIPSDRQVASCTHEELNAENSRLRRDRQSLSTLPAISAAEEKMQLRDRRTRQPTAAPAPPKAGTKTTNRRTTIAAASELPDPGFSEGPQTRRRSSAGSSVLSSMMDLKLDRHEIVPLQSTRPAPRVSSVGSAKNDFPIPPKKARAPARKPASAASSPRKARNPKAASTRSTATPENSLPLTSPSDGHSGPKSDAMDELTNGMKKISIKLKMPTQEEHVANLKRAEESGTLASKPLRKPPVPRFARTKAAPASKTVTKRASPDASKAPPQPLHYAAQKLPMDTEYGGPLGSERYGEDTIMDPTSSLVTSEVASGVSEDSHVVVRVSKPNQVEHLGSSSAVDSSTNAPDPVRYPSIKLESESPPPL